MWRASSENVWLIQKTADNVFEKGLKVHEIKRKFKIQN